MLRGYHIRATLDLGAPGWCTACSAVGGATACTSWCKTVLDEVVEDARVGDWVRVLEVQAVTGTGDYWMN